MALVTVYEFGLYDPAIDGLRVSRRWGTREGIKEHTGFGKVLEKTAVQVDESAVASDLPGLTEIGFDPHARRSGFQTKVVV